MRDERQAVVGWGHEEEARPLDVREEKVVSQDDRLGESEKRDMGWQGVGGGQTEG